MEEHYKAENILSRVPKECDFISSYLWTVTLRRSGL